MTPGIPYQYLPLERASDIRVLQVSLSPDSGRLYGNFKHISLDLAPPLRMTYAAFSYCWGTSEICDHIWFSEEHYLHLNSSAGSILRSIGAHAGAQFSDFFVWIDAVCINQSDNIEKGLQVSHMGKIYSSAMQVIAWIGDKSLDSDLAMEFVLKLIDMMSCLDLKGLPINRLSVTSAPGFEESSHGWKALANLLDRPWFSRIWIVQEVVLGADVLLLCGQKTLPWKALGCVVWLISIIGPEELFQSFRNDSYHEDTYHAAITYDFTLSREKGDNLSLEDNIFACFNFKATNPRDKLYALFGITTDLEALGIEVNYNSKIKEVFTDATVRILEQGVSLSLLNKAGAGIHRSGEQTTNEHDLPSWVPDFSNPHHHNMMLIGAPKERAHYKLSNASKATRSQIQICSSNPDTILLKLKGRLISQIATMYPLRPKPLKSEILHKGELNFSHIQIETKTLLGWIHETMNISSNLEPYPNGINRRQVYSRTLIFNRIPYSPPGRPTIPPSWKNFDTYLEVRSSFAEINLQNMTEREAKAVICERISEINFSDEDLERASDYASGIAAIDGRMFETGNGYLGMGPLGMMGGDEVCLFYGGGRHLLYGK